jgi:Protein of unknown function (DUF3489)
MRKPSKKPAKTRASKPKPVSATKAKPAHPADVRSNAGKKLEAVSKQGRVIAMLQSPAGTTIAAMMHATGWQAHSVRGFLAGVVRKKLKLKLNSEKVDGNRIYRVEGDATPSTLGSNRRAA